MQSTCGQGLRLQWQGMFYLLIAIVIYSNSTVSVSVDRSDDVSVPLG
jgi:hypothetical protein